MVGCNCDKALLFQQMFIIGQQHFITLTVFSQTKLLLFFRPVKKFWYVLHQPALEYTGTFKVSLFQSGRICSCPYSAKFWKLAWFSFSALNALHVFFPGTLCRTWHEFIKKRETDNSKLGRKSKETNLYPKKFAFFVPATRDNTMGVYYSHTQKCRHTSSSINDGH